MFIDDPYYADQKIKWWIYFTNWGLILLNTRLFMGALFLEEASKIEENLPIYFQNQILSILNAQLMHKSIKFSYSSGVSDNICIPLQLKQFFGRVD